MTVEQIAELVHSDQMTYARLIGEEPMKPWEESGKEHRHAVIEHVRFALGHPCVTARFLYQAWHPTADYDKLPVSQRVKFHLFNRTVEAFAEV
jgi:hypothetical protein